MSMNLTVLSNTAFHRTRVDWEPVTDRPIIGKDVLELLSSSMYVNPLSIYREYVQNAADAIDEARRSNILPTGVPGRVDITVDQTARTVRVRDNGIGLAAETFVERLVAFGASKKRGSSARGFRGVGRLAGLGYCQELIFRSTVANQDQICELRWDCRRLKAHLRDHQLTKSLEELVRDVVTTRTLSSKDLKGHFFEVELVGMIRHGDDALLDELAIENYLSQVAPVRFAPEFTLGREIQDFLASKVNMGNIEIHVNNRTRPIYRPHRDQFEVRKGVPDRFGALQSLLVPSSDGNIAAVGWLLHHSYLGALPGSSNMNGLRLRSGNMQVGDAHLMDEIFPETRFNSWIVGEIHVVDNRILPNGRRDHFEQNVHFHNVLNQLVPIARELARQCRTSSIKRNWMKQFELTTTYLHDRAAILRQGAISKEQRARLREEIQERLQRLEKIANMSALDSEIQVKYRLRAKRVASTFSRLFDLDKRNRYMARLGRPQRRLVQRLCDIIYQSSGSTSAARSLVETILKKL